MIREATKNDLLMLVELAGKYHASSDYKQLAEYDEESAGIIFLYCIENQNGYVWVLEKQGKVVGYLMAFNTPSLFNRNVITSQQMSWYVEPDSRGFESLQMLEAWKDWAEDQGCKIFSAGSQYRHTRAMKRVLGDGFEPVETMFVRGC